MSHIELPFLPEKRKSGKVTKLMGTIEDKEKYIVHISASKQALNHGLKLKKIHRTIQFKQKAWLKPYIETNTELRGAAKNDFEKDFFKLMNNSVFGKNMENLGKHGGIRLVTNDKQRSKLVSKSNYYTTKYVSENLMIIEMKKTQILMNKPIYLCQAILDISKTHMYEFWYDYIKSKYQDKAQLCYMDTDSFIIHIKTEDFYKDIPNDVSKWFHTSESDKKDNRPLPVGINKKVIGMFKDELIGKIMTEIIALSAKTYAFNKDNNKGKKKAKGTKKCVVKKDITFENYKDALFNNKSIMKSQRVFKSDHHSISTVEINKIALSSNDDKIVQTFDGITTYPIGTNACKVCESEMLARRKAMPIKLCYNKT